MQFTKLQWSFKVYQLARRCVALPSTTICSANLVCVAMRRTGSTALHRITVRLHACHCAATQYITVQCITAPVCHILRRVALYQLHIPYGNHTGHCVALPRITLTCIPVRCGAPPNMLQYTSIPHAHGLPLRHIAVHRVAARCICKQRCTLACNTLTYIAQHTLS